MGESRNGIDNLLSLVKGHEAEGRWPEALSLVAELLAETPAHFGALMAMGRIACRLGSADSAIAAFQRAFELSPHDRDARLEAATALESGGNAPEAEAILRVMAAVFPDDPRPWLRLAALFRRRGNMASAEEAGARLIAAFPDNAEGWASMAATLGALDRPAEAEHHLRKALALSPDYAQAHCSLAFLLLNRGDWEQGLTEFHWCDRLGVGTDGAPLWTGHEPPGTRVAVRSGQGFGDALQFLRYLEPLAERGHRPVVILPAPLVRLARTAPGAAEVVCRDDTLPAFDVLIPLPLCTLPYGLGLLRPEDSWRGPYLSAEKPAALPRRAKRAVGLSWAGSTNTVGGGSRHIPLPLLEPLFAIPDIDWFSLQLGPEVADLAASPWAGRVHDLSPRIGDFADTAALMAGLDLVITIDSAVAHLAGAMGRPTWIMLSTHCDWRWARTGATIGWYPSAHLFRQKDTGDWAPVVNEVATELTRWSMG